MLSEANLFPDDLSVEDKFGEEIVGMATIF